jgi:hypothetical protein
MCLTKTGSLVFDPSRLTGAERIAAARRRIRNSPTPPDKLKRRVGRLFRRCLDELPQAFRNNQVDLEAFIDLDTVYPLDVINGVKARFEKAGFTVEHTFRDDGITYEHLGFKPPADWIERLLALSEEGDKALEKATETLVVRL